MKKILGIIVVAGLVLVAIAALIDPALRYPYIGVALERDLTRLEGKDPVTVLLSVETGMEMLPEAQLSEEPAVQDEYSLLMVLAEEIKNQSESSSVTYRIEEMESEQWAWREAKLKKLVARTQIFPHSAAEPPQLEVAKESIMASAEVWTPLILSMWPKLPKGLLKAPKATWQEQMSFLEKNPIDGTSCRVNYNLVYRLDKFVNTDRGILANLLVVGSIVEGSEVDAELEVRGSYKGFILVEPDSGRAYGGEYRIEEQFLQRKPGLPVLRRTVFQGAKFWRPMFYKMSQERPELNTPTPSVSSATP